MSLADEGPAEEPQEDASHSVTLNDEWLSVSTETDDSLVIVLGSVIGINKLRRMSVGSNWASQQCACCGWAPSGRLSLVRKLPD